MFLQVIYIPEMFLEKALKGQRSNLVARKRKKKVRWGEGNKDERAEQYWNWTQYQGGKKKAEKGHSWEKDMSNYRRHCRKSWENAFNGKVWEFLMLEI